MQVMGYVYILSNQSRTLCVGVTSDLLKRIYQHKNGLTPGFATRYRIKQLVFFEEMSDMAGAIEREKQLKGKSRAWKTALIESMNPEWKDLSDGWF
jgi:putative endonuclease